MTKFVTVDAKDAGILCMNGGTIPISTSIKAILRLFSNGKGWDGVNTMARNGQRKPDQSSPKYSRGHQIPIRLVLTTACMGMER